VRKRKDTKVLARWNERLAAGPGSPQGSSPSTDRLKYGNVRGAPSAAVRFAIADSLSPLTAACHGECSAPERVHFISTCHGADHGPRAHRPRSWVVGGRPMSRNGKHLNHEGLG
jgi:hypothetical protein